MAIPHPGPHTRSRALASHRAKSTDHSQGQRPWKGTKTSQRDPGGSALERRGAEVCSCLCRATASVAFGPHLLEIRASAFTLLSAPGPRLCLQLRRARACPAVSQLRSMLPVTGSCPNCWVSFSAGRPLFHPEGHFTGAASRRKPVAPCPLGDVGRGTQTWATLVQ